MIYALTTIKGFAIDESLEIDRDAITPFRGRAGRFFPALPLLTQSCNHFFNVSGTDFTGGLLNLVPVDKYRIQLWKDFKGGLKGEI